MIVVLEQKTSNNQKVPVNTIGKLIFVSGMEDALQAVKNLHADYFVINTAGMFLPLLISRLHKLTLPISIMLIDPGKDYFMFIDKQRCNSVNHHISIES